MSTYYAVVGNVLLVYVLHCTTAAYLYSAFKGPQAKQDKDVEKRLTSRFTQCTVLQIFPSLNRYAFVEIVAYLCSTFLVVLLYPDISNFTFQNVKNVKNF